MYYSIGKQKVFVRKHQEKNGKLKIACKNRKYLEEEKSDNGLKVKNDNGPVNVFICYFSPSKGIRDISYYFLFDVYLIRVLNRYPVLVRYVASAA